MDRASFNALYQQKQNKFIELRTIIETNVNAFLRSLEELSAEDQQQLNVIKGQTAHDILPSLWVEPFNEATYQVELDSFNKYKERVMMFCDEYYKKAAEWLRSFT